MTRCLVAEAACSCRYNSIHATPPGCRATSCSPGGKASSWIAPDALIAQVGITIVPQEAALTEIARSAYLLYGKCRHCAGLNLGNRAVYSLARSRNPPLPPKGNDLPLTDLRLPT